MGRVEGSRELARRRRRRVKLKKLRKQFAATDNKTEREEIRAKARRISPFANLEETASA